MSTPGLPSRTTASSTSSTAPTEFPTPRDGLDTGSVAELAEDCRAIHLPHFAAHGAPHPHVDIDVPERATALVSELGDYGF
ncbi:hypothetical protein [Intrasporangium sp.]|uniref:hypothetical protein n=1 Tax=Intrasporangium sp. TaxID=1925024 RepID=UPI00293A1F9E|nr:hypothetical protein [Intrasporangium sp.]MDV3222939.1 hypothetical protein [Intrasporangium sp.]